MTKLLLVTYELHCTSAKNEGGTNKNGISNLFCNFYAVLDLCDRLTLGLWDLKLFEDLFKRISVFRAVDCLAIGADDLYSASGKGSGKVDRRLSAE